MTALRTLPMLLAAALAVLGADHAAAAVRPATGFYTAQAADLETGYHDGLFTVVGDGGKRRIVSYEKADGIYFPDPGACEDFVVPLATESIPISAKGRFEVRERVPVRKGSVLVVWKGKWTAPRRVAGTVRTSYRRCDSQVAWAGRRSKPTLRP